MAWSAARRCGDCRLRHLRDGGACKARNLQTGEMVDVPPMTQVRFRPGKGPKDAVNGGR